MTGPRLLTVVLNWRTAEMTLKSAKAALDAMAGISGELVIVDNDSQDGSEQMLRRGVAEAGWDSDGRVRVVQSGRNGGFGAGNNVGIRAGLSDGGLPDYVYILNSDAFPAPDAIRLLLEHLETNPDVGFAGSYIHGEEGDPHTTLFRYPTMWSEFEGAIAFGPVTRLLKNHVVPMEIPESGVLAVDWLAGASVMMRRQVLDQIGCFDERFFLYFEETDLCRRAQQAGWPTHYVRASEVAHIGSVSTGMKIWARTPPFWFDSRLYYFAKNHGPAYAAAATVLRLVGGGLRTIRGLVDRKARGGPKRFLSDLALHALGSLIRGRIGPAGQ
ncbi:MAG: glycosyltransferase family 2 protein [Pseudomonadota bacterium]